MNNIENNLENRFYTGLIIFGVLTIFYLVLSKIIQISSEYLVVTMYGITVVIYVTAMLIKFKEEVAESETRFSWILGTLLFLTLLLLNFHQDINKPVMAGKYVIMMILVVTIDRVFSAYLAKWIQP